MASSVVQSGGTNGTGTSQTVVLGAAPTAGNTLLASMASDTTAAAVPTAGAGNSYLQRLAQVGGQGFYVWTRLVAGGESATTTFTLSTASPASLQVFEIQGTYDKIGVGTTSTASAASSRTTNGLTPASADNTIIAIAGLHTIVTACSGGAVDNTFTFARSNFGTGTGPTLTGSVSAQKFTGSTSATGTTTLSWTGTTQDEDGVQIAFTGISGGAAFSPPVGIRSPYPPALIRAAYY